MRKKMKISPERSEFYTFAISSLEKSHKLRRNIFMFGSFLKQLKLYPDASIYVLLE